jgi:hypothetical protein
VSEERPSAKWRHDLKNQLGIVLGFSELALQELPGDHPLHADIEEVFKAAQRAMEILGQFDERDEAIEDA